MAIATQLTPPIGHLSMDIYPEFESSTLEFKAKVTSNDQVVKTVIAFCNLHGGRLIIGVADDRRIIGVPEDKIDQLTQSIQAAVFQSSNPVILPTIYTQRIGDKLILIVEVSSGMNKPYFKVSEGVNQGTYIRVGASSVRAGAEIVDELKWKNRGKNFDQTPVYSAQLSDLNHKAIEEFLKNKQVPHTGRITDRILESYGLVISEHGRSYPTVGAILLFGNDPQKFFSEAFFIVSEFESDDLTKTLATRDCVGSVIQQIDDVVSFLSSRLNTSYKRRNTRRVHKLEVPLEAIREVIVNAVVHRNYNVSGPSKVALFPNRIEVFSPGNFPGPLPANQIGNGVTYIRNFVIAKVLREAGYVEKLGSGFRIILDTCASAGLRRPLVFEGNNFVKCTIWREPADLETADPIILAIEQQGEVTTSDIQRACGVSRATAVRKLAALVKTGVIHRDGKGPSSKYKLTAKIDS